MITLRFISRCFLCGLLTVCLLCAAVLPAEAADVTGQFDARLYQSRLDQYAAIKVYNVSGEDGVPYISVQEYLTDLYGSNVSFKRKHGGNLLVVTRNNSSVEFDVKKASISSKDWDAFFGSYGERALPNGILLPAEFQGIAVSHKHPSTETEATTFSIDLPAYGLQMMAYDGQILLPFAVLQNIFALPCGASSFSFNGDDFYDIKQPVFYIYGHNRNPNIKLNPYSTAYYSGKFSQAKEIPPAYVRYAYGSTCLLLDLYYGHKKEKGIDSFDRYLEENGLKEGLLSTDTDKNSDAFLDLVYRLFDSGHDDVQLEHSVFNSATYTNTVRVAEAYGGIKPTLKALQSLTYKLADMGVDFLAGETGTYEQYQIACRQLNLDSILLTYIFRDDSQKPCKIYLEQAKDYMRWRGTPEENFEPERMPGSERGKELGNLIEKIMHIKSLKPDNFGTSRVDIIGNTAFIYFEGFSECGAESSFYYNLPDKNVYDISTFGLFYDAFAKIQKKPQVKKVVIDLSNNGGGAVSALIAILGFLSPDGEANLTYFHTLNQNYCSEWYHVDTNLDGKFDDADGFGGKYDFYILTSGYSYSCANALPFLAQADGLAKIIGEQPGGGDCMVAGFLDAYGHVARMSGWNKMGRMSDGQFVSDEHAVKVDFPFGDEADKLYFNYEAIAQWLKGK